MISDNGANFVGAERELRSEMHKLNEAKIQDYLLQNSLEIKWKFNPPAASHFGENLEEANSHGEEDNDLHNATTATNWWEPAHFLLWSRGYC